MANAEKQKNDFVRTYKTLFRNALPALQNVDDDEHTRRAFLHGLFIRLLFVHFLNHSTTPQVGNPVSENLLALWETHNQRQEVQTGTTRDRFYTDYLLPLFIRIPFPFLTHNSFTKKTKADKDEVVPDRVFHEMFEKLLRQYRFTLSEPALDAIDPEILGRVFEKLILPNDRQSKGTFYTPGLLVSFMCRESLKGYLHSILPSAIGAIARLLEESDNSMLSPSEAEILLAALGRLRVVDPACGSGAYLLGMMRILCNTLCLLEDRSGNPEQHNNYARKLQILRRNLHGVDIEPFATQITCMRLWLSLLAESPTEFTFLPNLDFKIQTEYRDRATGKCSGGNSITAPAPCTICPTDKAQAIAELKEHYFHATGERKVTLAATIRRKEREIASRVLGNVIPAGAFDWSVRFIEIFTNKAAAPGGFHIVIANPPYGGTGVDDATRFRYFPRPANGTISREVYGIFMARALELLVPGGTFCFLVSNTWRTIRSFQPLRERLLQQTMIRHLLDLPNWIFDATVNTGIVTLTNTPAPPDYSLTAGDLTGLPRGDWQALEENLRLSAGPGTNSQTAHEARYTYPQEIIRTHENRSFFIASPELHRLFRDTRFHPLDAIADIRVGLQTGDNARYLRKRKGVRGVYDILTEAQLLTEAEIAHLSDEEKRKGVDPTQYDGRYFVPYDKGGASDARDGWLPNYYVPTSYFIDWSQEAVQRMNTQVSSKARGKTAARFQNSTYYFQSGITWSDVGFYSPTVRCSGTGVFDVKGSRLIVHAAPTELVLAVLCSKLGRYIIKNFLNHTVSTQSEDLRLLPFPRQPDPTISERIGVLVAAIITKQKATPRYPYHLHEQREIDALVYELYGLKAKEIQEVTLWYSRRYPDLAHAQGY